MKNFWDLIIKLLTEKAEKSPGKTYWFWKWTIRWTIILSAGLFLSGCVKESGKVQAVESVWKWENFLQNLLKNFAWVDKSKSSSTISTISTIYGVDPQQLLYATICGAVIASTIWLVIVFIMWIRYRKLDRQFGKLVSSADYAEDIPDYKRICRANSAVDGSFRRRIMKYANRDKTILERLKKRIETL